MKMKNVLLSLSLAGLCLSQASAQAPLGADAFPAARHIGDQAATPAFPMPRHVGDSAAMSTDQRPAEFKANNARLVSQSALVDFATLAPTAASCDTTGSSGYGVCGTGKSKRWFSAETLLWFSEDLQTPTLATTSAQGVLPVAGANGVTNAFGGGDGVDTGLLPGFRVAGGMYIDDCEKIGVGGRAYGIFSDSTQYNANSNGTTSLGVPFYNLALQPNPGNDAYLVGFTTAGNAPVAAGDLNARVDLDMIGAEASIYMLLGRSSDHRIDLVSGYTFNKLKNSVGLRTQSTNLFTGDLIPDGTVFTTNDLFATENIFNGAHLGVLSSVVHSRVSLSTLAKVSFGNMRQSSTISGSTNQTLGNTSNDFAGGLFAQQSNIGTLSRDTFAFIPELGLKLGYSCRENVQLTVGYTFMMWSSVALAGEQMDSTLDLTQVNGPAGTRPATNFQDGSFWMQGIDLGLSWTY